MTNIDKSSLFYITHYILLTDKFERNTNRQTLSSASPQSFMNEKLLGSLVRGGSVCVTMSDKELRIVDLSFLTSDTMLQQILALNKYSSSIFQLIFKVVSDNAQECTTPHDTTLFWESNTESHLIIRH